MRPQRGVRGGPGMRGQRMGRPGIARRPGVERLGSVDPEYSISDLHESDVSPVSLAEFPTNVRIVGIDEFDEASFDDLEPLIVRRAAARASEKWTDEWLLRHFRNVPCQVTLHSRPASREFR